MASGARRLVLAGALTTAIAGVVVASPDSSAGRGGQGVAQDPGTAVAGPDRSRAAAPLHDRMPLLTAAGSAALAQDRRRAERLAALVDRSPAQLRRERELVGLDAAGAVAALRDSFPAFAARLPERAPGVADEVVSFAGPNLARLTPEQGRRRFLLSTRPVAVPSDGGLAPADLTLRDAGVERTPRRAPFVARIGEDPRTGFEVGPTAAESVSVVPLDGDDAPLLDGVAGGLMWPNTHRDTDSIAAVVTGGVETFEQLRSVEAPAFFRYRLGLRAGQRAVARGGAIEIEDAGGSVVVRALSPTAADRNGRPVPARIELDGTDRVTVTVDHRLDDYAYPVLLDPTWESSYPWSTNPATGNNGWGVEQTDGGGWYDAWAGTDPRWAGLYARPTGGRVYPPGTEVKVALMAPGTTRIAEAHWLRFTTTNNRHRQTTRLALYGGPQPVENDYFSTWPGGELPSVDQTGPGGTPAGANVALLWMFTPPCGATERDCPRLIPVDGLTIAKVGAVDLVLTDDDLPAALAEGEVRDLAGTWTARPGSFAVTIGGSDPGSGVRRYTLSATHGGTTQQLAGREVPCDELHANDRRWGSNVCPGEERLPYDIGEQPEGEVRYAVDAVDLAGNAGRTEWTVFYDRVAPALQVDGPLVEAAAGWTRAADTLTARLRASDGGAGVREIRLVGRTSAGEEVFEQVVRTCEPAGPLAQPCPAAPTANVPVALAQLPSGALTFEATATDQLGHVAPARSWTLRVDRSRPVARVSGALVDAPRPARASNETAPMPVTVTAKDATNGAGIASIELFAENAEGRRAIARAVVCTAAPAGGGCPSRVERTFAIDPLSLPEGVSTFHAITTDLAGNRSEPSDDFESFQDHVPPESPSGLKVTAAGETTLEVTWDRSTDGVAGSGVSHYQYRVVIAGQPSEWVNVNAPGVTLPSMPSATTVEVIVRALDFAENPSRYVTRAGRANGRRGRSGGGDDDELWDDEPGSGSGGGGPTAGIASASRNRNLALTFRPHLLFDSGERWSPIDVWAYLRLTPMYVCGPVCSPVSRVSRLAEPYWNKRSAYMDDIHRPLTDVGAHTTRHDCVRLHRECKYQNAAVYYQMPGLGLTTLRYINYWLFYRFNSVPSQWLVKKFRRDLLHEADWEVVTVAVDPNAPRSFVWVGFSSHGKLYRYTAPPLRCGSTGARCTRYGKHVNVFVASGTHANYPFECSATTPFTCNQTDLSSDGIVAHGEVLDGRAPWEAGHDGRQRWVNNERDETLIRLPNASESAWVDWPGNWNEEEHTQIYSPAYNYSRSDNYPIYMAPWGAQRWSVRNDEDEHAARPASAGPRAGAAGRPPAARAAAGGEGPVPDSAFPATPEADCPSWNGPGIAASVCDAARLEAELRATPVADDGGPLVARGGDAVEGMPGLAQLGGEPLRPGEQVAISRIAPSAELRVQVESPGWRGTLLFTGVEAPAGEPAALTVAQSPQRSVVRLADGREIAPLRSGGAAIPAAPGLGRVRRSARRIEIRLRGRATSTTVELLRRCSAPNALRTETIATRRGRMAAVSLRRDRRARAVRVTSISPAGVSSATSPCKGPR